MTANQITFATTYREELEKHVARNPDDYMLAPNETASAYADRVAPRMVDAYIRRSGNIGPSTKATLRRLGLKTTYAALYAFLAE